MMIQTGLKVLKQFIRELYHGVKFLLPNKYNHKAVSFLLL